MTRDALEMTARTPSGRAYTLVDTGGLDLDAAGGFAEWTSDRALAAVADADLILFVLDGIAGRLPEDERLARKLHALGKNVVVAWNKCDAKAAAESLADGFSLGFSKVIGVSALHGTGADELLEAIETVLPSDLDPDTRTEPLPIAIVGRPNVGKSSLVDGGVGGDRVRGGEGAGRGLLLVPNKWAPREKDRERATELKHDTERRFIFLRKAPFLPLSATTGKGVQRFLPEADALAKRFTTRMSTGELNLLLQKSFEREEPRGRSGRNMKIRYAVQVAAEPPLIRLFADRTEPLHFSFERFLQNRIREKWNLNGVPLKFVVKKDD